MIYLDWNATAPLRDEAWEAMQPFLRGDFGNPSSIHAAGRKARVAVDDAREQVAELIGAEPRDIVFTSGATEANNLFLFGAARLQDRPAVVSTPVEHPSVMEPLAELEEQGAIEWNKLQLDQSGNVLNLEETLGGDLAHGFATVMAANNETGVLFPLAEIAEKMKSKGAWVHSDLTQAVGRVPVDMKALGLDAASLSAHKIGGPKGVGALAVRRGVELEKLLFGGRQERSRRPGTENVPGIVGFGAAAAAARRDLEDFTARAASLRTRLWHGIKEIHPDAVLNTPLENSVPSTLNVSFQGFDGNFLLQRLDLAGVCVSSGAACSSGNPEPSPVLLAMDMDPDRVKGALRFSLGYRTTQTEIDDALNRLKGVLEKG